MTAEQEAVRDRLSVELNLSAAAAALLVRRQLTSADAAREFIRPSLDKMHDPFLMKGMHEAVDRLRQALNSREKILIYGDYDVDGTTAVALMYRFLEQLQADIDFYIPDRYAEGYGISFKGIDYAQQEKRTLIIALDVGIKAVDKVEYARQKGIDMIICDHHKPGDTLPQAVAVLDSQQEDDPYPYKALSGCGVGFKLAQAYTQQAGLSNDLLEPLLELTAMSVASDIVPVTGENRILAAEGIKRINKKPSIGVRGLLRMAECENKPVTIHELAYRIGPRLNACGRIETGREAVKLLITKDEAFAQKMAADIESYNAHRRELDQSIAKQAIEMLEADPTNKDKCTTVVYQPDWHRGVIGIVASRLLETYYRPTIVLAKTDAGLIAGSARSVAGFNIYEAIDACSDLLTTFGGHTFAAGLSMTEDAYPEFCRRFEAFVAEHITPDQQQRTLQVEAEINLEDIDERFYSVIRALEPCGPENPTPLFVTRRLFNNRYTRRVGKMGEHLKLDLTDGEAAIGGIAFRKGDEALYIQNGNKVDVCYSLQANTFNGQTRIEMFVEDIKPSSHAD